MINRVFTEGVIRKVEQSKSSFFFRFIHITFTIIAKRSLRMKLVLKIILITFILSASNSLLAQVQGKFGSNQNTLDVNAVIEVESTSKGVLLPRLTTAQQNAMSAPTNGMLIYNTDSACLSCGERVCGAAFAQQMGERRGQL